MGRSCVPFVLLSLVWAAQSIFWSKVKAHWDLAKGPSASGVSYSMLLTKRLKPALLVGTVPVLQSPCFYKAQSRTIRRTLCIDTVNCHEAHNPSVQRKELGQGAAGKQGLSERIGCWWLPGNFCEWPTVGPTTSSAADACHLRPSPSLSETWGR